MYYGIVCECPNDSKQASPPKKMDRNSWKKKKKNKEKEKEKRLSTSLVLSLGVLADHNSDILVWVKT